MTTFTDQFVPKLNVVFTWQYNGVFKLIGQNILGNRNNYTYKNIIVGTEKRYSISELVYTKY